MGEAWHRKSAEAEKYTTDMWQRQLSDTAMLCVATEPQRRAFLHGFNGDQIRVHHKVRPWFDRGRHAALLLGYLP